MKKLMLNTSGGEFLIDIGAIVRVEASSNYSKLFFSDGKVLVTAKLLRWFEERLQPESFTRLNRSHLINNRFLHLHQCTTRSVELQNGKIIPVSRRRKKHVLQQLAAACIFQFFFSAAMHSQNVGIGTNTPQASAQLEINSTTKGTLITTMTSVQRKAIVSPATGLLVYDINKKTVYMFDGNKWLPFLFSNVEKNPASLAQPAVISANSFFGHKVDIDGDYAVIGAYARDLMLLPDVGAAYIFYRNNGVWEEQDLITASDPGADDYFGASVSISGDYAVIGACGDDIGADDNQGSAYVFLRSGSVWTQQAKLTASDGLANDFFGYSVSISGNVVIVGAYGDNIGANTNQGSAYIFTRSGVVWTQEAKLTASDGDFGDNFGASVSISGSYAMIGAYADDIGANVDQGSAYSFYEFTNAGGWTSGQAYHDKLTASDGEADDFFGVSVSINGSSVIIGASGDDIGANSSQGSAYTFFRNPVPPNVWILPEKIIAPDGAANDNFGISVSKSNVYSVIGSYRDDGVDGISNQGSAYVFNTGSSTPFFLRKIDDDAADANGYFGYSVGISGYEIIIGAYGKNNNSGQVGFLNVQ